LTGTWFRGIVARTEPPAEIDTGLAHPARIYNYWLGGKDNFAADREAGSRALEADPGILHGVRANRRFLKRAVHHLASETGIRQFLDLGAGLPAMDNTHEVAQAAAPGTRVAYVDNDPIVLAHARALLTGTLSGCTTCIDVDIRDTAAVLADAARFLDFSQPVAVMMLMVLQLIPDSDDPQGIVTRLMAALAPGSYLVLSDTASDIRPDIVAESQRRLNARMAGSQTRRSRAQIQRYFTGLDMLPPGLVPLNQWRPAADDPDPGEDAAAYCGIGRKPLSAA
jgi:O-methyltransferase involved in polyketide biosynthesis